MESKKLKSICLIEGRPYEQKDLVNLLEYDNGEKALNAIRKLKEYGVLKAVNKSYAKDLSDIQDDDVELCEVDAGEMDRKYVLNFVGVIVVNGRILKCYPKYLSKFKRGDDGPKEEMRQIMSVLEKYDRKKEQTLHMLNDVTDLSENSTNLLDLYLFFLWDYYENGLYSNVYDTIETNGSGEILWEKTVNEIDPIFSCNRPIYPEIYTRKHIDDDYDYFKRLHRYILTDVSRQLEEADLIDLFGLEGVDFLDEAEEDFEDEDYVLYRLDGELNRQFNSSKQLLLKAMKIYIRRDIKLSDEKFISSYGTANFNLVWEGVLSAVFDNKRETSVDELGLFPIDNSKISDYSGKKLMQLIDKPYWTKAENFTKDTLIPDILSIVDDDCAADKKRLLILDAKYYTPDLKKGETPHNMPGVGDVAKQYLYQLALQGFIDYYNLAVENYFLFPTGDDKAEDAGEVRLDFLSNGGMKHNCDSNSKNERKFKLEDIKACYLPAKKVFDCYLDNKRLSIDELRMSDDLE